MESLNPDSRFVLNPSDETINVDSDTGEIIETALRPYGVGIDCHSRFYQCCVKVKNTEGENYKKYDFSFKAIPKDVSLAKLQVLMILKAHNQNIEEEFLHYTCESTGPYHRPLVLNWRGEPCIVNPLLATPSRRKTDVLDSQLLAHYDLTGLFPKSYLAPESVQEVKQLFNEARRFQRNKTQATNRIGNLFTYYGNTIAAMGKVNSSSIRPIIEDYCRGKDVEHDGLFKRPPKQICDSILNLYNVADENIEKAQNFQKQAVQIIKKSVFENLNGEISGKDLLKILTSVPGIGELTAALFISEIGSPLRFPNIKAIASYCGFDPSVKVSAGKVTSHRMRKGNKHLHSSILRCGGVLVMHHKEYFGNFGWRIYKKNAKGGYKKAANAVGRKIVTALYICWLRGEEFSYDKYNVQKYEIEDVVLDNNMITKLVLTKLHKLNIFTSVELYESYNDSSLFQKGFGVKSIKEVELCLSKLKRNSVSNMNKVFS